MIRAVHSRFGREEKAFQRKGLSPELPVRSGLDAYTWERRVVDFFPRKCRSFFHKIFAAVYIHPTSLDGRSD